MTSPRIVQPTWDHEPDLSGLAGRAWEIDVSKLEHPVPDTRATLAVWLLDCPGAHLLWNWYLLSAVHLRPMGGVRPAHIRLAGATHEILVLALNPEHAPPDPREMRLDRIHYLTPIDVEEQFIVGNDGQAGHLCRLAAEACCNGTLSPDQDWRSAWRRAVEATAEHLRREVHGRDA